MENKKYLDLEGLNYYHGKLVDNQIAPLSGEIDLIGSNLSEYRTATDATIDGIENTLGNKVDYEVSTADYSYGDSLCVPSAASNGSVAIAVTMISDTVEDSVSPGVIQRSTNGKDWEVVRTEDEIEYLIPKTVAYGNGIFCTEDCFTMDNGATWGRTAYADIAVKVYETRGVCFDNGRFYTMTSGGQYGSSLLASRPVDTQYNTMTFEVIRRSYSVGDVYSFTVKNNICIIVGNNGMYYYDLSTNSGWSNEEATSCILGQDINEAFEEVGGMPRFGAVVSSSDKFYTPVYFDDIKYGDWMVSADGINWSLNDIYPSEVINDGFINSFALFGDTIYITAEVDNRGNLLICRNGDAWEVLQENSIHGFVYDYIGNGPAGKVSHVQCTGGNVLVYATSAYGEAKGIASGSIIGLGDTIINQINQTVIAAEEDEISGIFG